MNEFFKEWHQREIHKDHLFITDGAIDDKLWNDAKIKVLFLLKEAYDSKNTTGSWDLSGLIRKRRASGRTFKPMGQWASGIQRLALNGQLQEYIEGGEEVDNALLSSAIINIKKSGGKNKSSWSNLFQYAKSDWDLIQKQIDSLNPDIIVCGNTWSLIKDNLTDKKKISDRVHKAGNHTYVNYWHPSNRASNSMNYYALCALVSQAFEFGSHNKRLQSDLRPLSPFVQKTAQKAPLAYGS